MTNNLACLRRARDRARGLAPSVSHLRRWSVAVGLAAAVFVTASGVPTPARADIPPDPVARVQLVIKSVHIYDDRDLFGAGDMRWQAELCTTDVLRPAGCYGASQDMFGGDLPFHADTGDDVTIDRVVPRSGDSMTPDVTPEAGMPVYAGRSYTLFFSMSDADFVSVDWMGSVHVPVNEGNGWSIGTFTTRSVSVETDTSGDPGNYAVTWEIRKTPLPDLVNRGIRLIDAGDGQFYCVTVQNIGERPSGPAPLAVRADGTLVRATTVSALEPLQTIEHCVLRSELPARQHHLSFMVDEERQLPEMDESNNHYEWGIPALAPTGAAPTSSASTTVLPPEPKPAEEKPEPGGDKADLVVRSIRVNDQAPDGKNDCKAGTNDLAVLVKNVGKGDADSFAVRLAVDGDGNDATVESLRAGEEREVRFDDVQLKKGEHALKAVADAERAVAESKEDNNELKANARCTEAS
jgi:hypothetical protein